MSPIRKRIALLVTAVLVISSIPLALDAGAVVYGTVNDLQNTDASFLGGSSGDKAPGDISCRGDVNGDGYDDIVIGAPSNNDLDLLAGKFYVIFGKSSGWSTGMSLNSSDASFIGANIGDQLGKSVKIVGDVNGDGFDDIAVSAPSNSDSGMQAGKVYIIFGKATGWAKNIDIETAANASFLGENDMDDAGSVLAGAGDINLDGYDDILIGVSKDDENGNDAGKVHVVFGKADGWALNESLAESDIMIKGDGVNDNFGSSLAIVGDVNGDMYDDIIIGALGASPRGMTFLVLGKSAGWTDDNVSDIASASFDGEGNADSFGLTVSRIGDINGDGLADLAFGAPWNDAGANNGGQVYLFFGKTTGWALDTTMAQANASFVGMATDMLGLTLAGAGDVNGDGLDDLLMGSPLNNEYGASSGQAYLVLGKKQGWTIFGVADARFHGEAPGDSASNVLAGMGDVNGDGNSDILIGAFQNDDAFVDAGKVSLIFFKQNPGPTDIGSIKAYTGQDYVTETNYAVRWDDLYIELKGTDKNASSKDIALATVKSSATPIDFQMKLFETGNDTGTYRGMITVANITSEELGWISADVGDVINISSFHNSSVYTLVHIGPLELTPAMDVVNATEDELYNVHYDYANVTVPIWDFDTNATWLDFNETTQNLTGTPNNTHVTGSPYWVMLNLSDEFGRFLRHDFEITVKNTPPSIIPDMMANATQDLPYLFDMNSSDDGQGTITWSMRTDAGAWLGFNNTTASFNGTPRNADVGHHWVNVTVDDGNGGLTSSNLTLNVLNVNDPPQIITADVPLATEEVLYWVAYNVSDPDVGDTHTWDLQTNAEWVYIGKYSGVLTGIPSNDDVGTYWMNVTVTDSGGLQDTHYFWLIVQNVNDAPYWVNEPYDITIGTKDTLEETVLAQDYDEKDIVTYDLTTAPTTTATINSTTGKVLWDQVTAGSFLFNVTATDGKATIFSTFTVTVVMDNVAPHAVLVSPAKGTTVTTARPTFTWTVSDENSDEVFVDLYISQNIEKVNDRDMLAKAVSGIKETTYTLDFDLVPGKTYYWAIIPFDGIDSGTCDNGPFDIIVSQTAPINHAPVIEKITDQKVKAGEDLSVQVKATDQNAGDVLTYMIIDPPANMTISATGKITWKPTKEQVGNYTIVIKVNDGKLNVTTSFKLQVEKATDDGGKDDNKVRDQMIIPLVILMVVLLFILAAGVLMRQPDEKSDKKADDIKKDEKVKTSSEEEE